MVLKPSLRALRWFTVLLALAVVSAQAIVWFRQRSPNVIEIGTAAVGAPFTLFNSDGRRVSDADFRGTAVVIVFGWTRDPDVTPAVLQLLMAVHARLGPKDNRFYPIFISVDAARDANIDLRVFSERYGSALVILGGAEDDISALTKAYRLPVTRIPDPVLPNGYSLDLPSVYYVLGKDGRFRGAVPYTTDVKALAGELRKLTE